MRLTTLTYGLAALLSTTALADSISTPTPSITASDDYRAEITPFPHGDGELVEDTAHLEIRQNLGVNPDAEQQVGQVPPVTIYTIATQLGATGMITQLTYTQLFSPVPDQWPGPKSGVIGFGTDKKKRAVETVDVLDVEQPVVMVLETEVVTVPLQKVTEVLVVESLVVMAMKRPENGTALGRNGSSPEFAPSAGYTPLFTGALAPTAAAGESLGTMV